VIGRKWRGGRPHNTKHTPNGTLITTTEDKLKGGMWGFVTGSLFGAAVGASIGIGVEKQIGTQLGPHVVTGIVSGGVALLLGIIGALIGSKVLLPKWNWPVIRNRLSAPAFKFIMDFIQCALMCVLLSYIVLKDLKVREDNVFESMIFEHALALWIVALIAEEVRQTFDDGWNMVYFYRWYADVWNKMDVVIYLLFSVTYALRVSQIEVDMLTCKGMYALNSMIVWMRLFKYFGNHPKLGPKVIILGNLVDSLMQYLVLLAVFIVAFGIFTEAMANPSFPLGGGSYDAGRPQRDWMVTMHNVLYRPYFQMYGELMLEDISSETRCAGQGNPFTNCSSIFESIFLPMFTGIFLIVTSLMVMNMLIADFTLTFEANYEESAKIWKMERFKMLQEYDSKPWLPVPFSLPVVLKRFIGNIPDLWSLLSRAECPGCMCCLKDNQCFPCCPSKPCGACEYCVALCVPPTNDQHETQFKIEASRRIEDFQDRCCDIYLAESEKEKYDGVEFRVARIENAMLSAQKELEFFKGKSYSQSMRRRDEATNGTSKTEHWPMYPKCTIKSTLRALAADERRKTAKSPTKETEHRLDLDLILQTQISDVFELELSEFAKKHWETVTVKVDDLKPTTPENVPREVGDWCILRGAWPVVEPVVGDTVGQITFRWSEFALGGKTCSFYQEVAVQTELSLCDVSHCICRCVAFDGNPSGLHCKSENPHCRHRKIAVAIEEPNEEPNPLPNPFGQNVLGDAIHTMRKQVPYNNIGGDLCKIDHAAVWNGEKKIHLKLLDGTSGEYAMRGELPSLGRNHFVCHIVTRWKKDEAGMLLDRGGKKLLEFVAFKRHEEDDQWSIPSLQVDWQNVQKWKHKILKDKQDIVDKKQNKSGKGLGEEALTIAETELKLLKEDMSRPDSSSVIANSFNSGYSATAYYAFHEKNFKTTIAAPQKKWVKENVNKLFDTTCSPHESQDQAPFLGKMIYEGFMDDERSFGKAYSFVSVFMHHDEDDLLDAFNLTTTRTDPHELEKLQKGATHCIQGLAPGEEQCEDFYEHAEAHEQFSLKCVSPGHTTGCDIFPPSSSVNPAPAEAAWLTLHRDLDLCGEEEDLLRHVAGLHDAYWG
jgi:hypothetical protein